MYTFILFLFVIFNQDIIPTYFTLISTDCKLTGPVDGKEIVSYSATSWTATCTVKNNQILIASMDLESKKPLGSENYDYMVENGIGIAISEGGGIRFIFDFNEKKFCHGQVNIVTEKGIILTKTCIGLIELK